MASKFYGDVCFGRPYKDKQGNEKKQWLKVGSAFKADRGGLTIKLDAVPLGGADGCWLSIFEPKQNNSGNSNSQPADDELPF